MLEISFQSDREAEAFYRMLGCQPEISLLASLMPPNQVHINAESLTIEGVVIPALIGFITEQMEHMLVLSIIENQFFFKDRDEQQQILHIAQSLMEGERSDIPNIRGFFDRADCIKEALHPLLKPDLSFSFHSFLTFRLQDYKKRLAQYAEAAIEEYKLEQEYQNFIQFLREYVLSKSSQMDKVHIFYRKRFVICDEYLQEMPEQTLRSYVDRSLLYHHPMYIDSALLAPLVCIAPKSLFLYTDEPDHGMVQTIQNIFQERVRICPLGTADAFQEDSSKLS